MKNKVEGTNIPLAKNGGGWLGNDAAAIVVKVISS